jgi:hypothetical protein
MNRFLCLIGLVLAILHGAHSTVEFTNTVLCSAQGFKPSFVYNDGLDTDAQILAVKVVLGPSDVTESSASAWCSGSVPSDNDPAQQTAAMTVDAGNLGDGTHYTDSANGGLGEDYIPYEQATDSAAPGTDETRCGGSLVHATDDDADSTEIIKYEVYAKVIVRRKFRNTIIRTTQYPFIVRCAVTRDHSTLSTGNGFTVATQLIDDTSISAENQKVRSTITYAATLKLYTDSTFGTAASQDLEINNDASVYIQVEQGANQELFKFHVDQCFSTVNSDPAPGTASHKDIFYDNGCPADSTVVAAVDGTDPTTKYNIQMDSFYFPGQASTAVYFHCEVTICLADSTATECVVKTDCATSNPINEDTTGRRRRRSLEEEGVIGSKMITSSQSVLIDRAQVFAPSCGNGFIYDRVSGGCSNENLVEINGIYLGAAAWDPAYANVTSDAFKSMAAAREYQLWVLLQVTRRSEYIRGVKIIRARQGSVILDVIIKHAASVSAEEAFHQMEKALKTEPSTTRVMNLLQIREEKTIELVPIVVAGEKSDTEKLILIVVVVVLFVVVFVAGVTLFKVRQGRQQSASTTTSFDNKGVDA